MTELDLKIVRDDVWVKWFAIVIDRKSYACGSYFSCYNYPDCLINTVDELKNKTTEQLQELITNKKV